MNDISGMYNNLQQSSKLHIMMRLVLFHNDCPTGGKCCNFNALPSNIDEMIFLTLKTCTTMALFRANCHILVPYQVTTTCTNRKQKGKVNLTAACKAKCCDLMVFMIEDEQINV